MNVDNQPRTTNHSQESTSVESYPATNPLDDDTCNAQVVTDDGGSSKQYRGIAPPDFLEKGQQLRCAGGTSFQASEDVRDDAEFKKNQLASFVKGTRLEAVNQVNVNNVQVTPEESKQALQVIRSCVKANPKALGIALVVSHKDVHPDIAYTPLQSVEENSCQKRLNSLPGIEHGAKQLKKAFKMCGLAVIRIENPSKKFLFAIMRAMNLDKSDPMAIKYPASYQYLFFYTTGHGADLVFFTKDGSVSYQDVYNLYQGFLHQRYFFFDCCRSIRRDSMSLYPNGDRVIPSCPEFTISRNNCIIFATVSGHQAWGPGEGVSFMTKKMVALLKKQKSMNDVLSCLKAEISKEVQDSFGNSQQVVVVDATPSIINLWEEQKQAMNPTLHASHLSSDSAVIHLSATFPTPVTSSSCHEQNTVEFQMESLSGFWNTLFEVSAPINVLQPADTTSIASAPYVALQEADALNAIESLSGSGNTSSEVSAPINVPQLADPTSIASASNVALQEAESGHDLLVSSDHSNSTQQAASNASQHTVSCALMIPVTEVGKRTAKFRVVADLTGGLILESNSVNESIDLARPVISECETVIQFKGGQEPRVSICWTIGQVPLTISYQQFIIHIYKEGNLQPVRSKEIDLEPTKECYEESFDVPGLSDHTDGDVYSIVVEAKRADGQTVCSERITVCSERIPLETTKGCYYCLSLLCLVGFVIFFLFGTAIIALVLSMIGINTSEMNEYRYNASAMLSYATLGIPTAQRNTSFFDCLLHLDYKNQQVIKHNNKDIDLYCGQFTKLQLANSRTPEFWGPNDIEINQRNKKLEVPVDFLPIGSSIPSAINLLPRSIFSVYLCLSAPVDGTIVFELYRYEHFTTSEPLQRKAVTFNYSTFCSNTSLNVLEPNLVIGALSTNSTIHPEFTTIEGYVQQYYYDEKYLGLINDTYLVGDQPKTIPGSIETELVCYADGDRSRTVFFHLFSVLVPTAWTVWTVIVIAIVIAIILVVVVIAFIFCIFHRTLVRFVCNQCRQCRQRCGYNSYRKFN